MEKEAWDKRDLTPEVVNKYIQELEIQILAFELRVKYENKLVAFRDIYLAWYEGRLMLDDLLEAMMDRSLCKRITPFSRA